MSPSTFAPSRRLLLACAAPAVAFFAAFWLLPAVQLESELMERARLRMSELAARLGTPPLPWRVETGNVKNEILRAAREGNHDLIVIGSRERHGMSILVNFTEDTVLHGAPCDVLAVRIGANGA